MEFPRLGVQPMTDGLIPMCDLCVKHLQCKEDRQTLLDAMSSETSITKHAEYVINTVSNALEARGCEVALLQEIGSDIQGQLMQLCQQKGWHVCFSAGNPDPTKCDAITSIIAKKPFDQQMPFDFQENKKVRQFAAARLGTAWLVSCHVPLSNQVTDEQKQDVGVRLVQELSQRFFGSGWVLCVGGDWNANINGVKNRIQANIPYGCSQVTVHTDSRTTVGVEFPVDGIVCLR